MGGLARYEVDNAKGELVDCFVNAGDESLGSGADLREDTLDGEGGEKSGDRNRNEGQEGGFWGRFGSFWEFLSGFEGENEEDGKGDSIGIDSAARKSQEKSGGKEGRESDKGGFLEDFERVFVGFWISFGENE